MAESRHSCRGRSQLITCMTIKNSKWQILMINFALPNCGEVLSTSSSPAAIDYAKCTSENLKVSASALRSK